MSGLPSGLSEVVADHEDLARFLTSSSWFASTKGIVKPGAFLPNPRKLETSVFRQAAKAPEALWETASENIPEERTIHGAAIVGTAVVRSVALDVVADETPPNAPKHANIVGWPRNERDPREEKNIWKDLANVIASKSDLLLKERQIDSSNG